MEDLIKVTQPNRIVECKITGLKKDRHGNLWGSKQRKQQDGSEVTLRWINLELKPVDHAGAGTLDGEVAKAIIKPVLESKTPLYGKLKEIYERQENGGETAIIGQTITVQLGQIDLAVPCKVVLRDAQGAPYVSKHPKTGKPNERWSINTVRFLNEADSMHKLQMAEMSKIAAEVEHGGGFFKSEGKSEGNNNSELNAAAGAPETVNEVV